MPPSDSTASPALDSAEALALLRWQVAMGADEAIGLIAPNRLAPPPIAVQAPPPSPAPQPRLPTPAPPRPASVLVGPPDTFAGSLAEAAQSARRSAETATTIEELAAAVAGFADSPLKPTATHTGSMDGHPS